MKMRLNEIHAAAVHGPLTLIPLAAGFDLAAAITGRDDLAKIGKWAWLAGVGAATFAGVSGMAASQEVVAKSQEARDAMLIHGLGNAAILVAGLGMATLRIFREPTIATAITGVVASGAAVYTAFLGGEIVYGHGVGVRPAHGTEEEANPPILSRAAPRTFVRDVGRGAMFLVRGAGELFRGELAPSAAKGGEEPEVPVAEYEPPQLEPTV